MARKLAPNPEKAMILLFPAITLGAFVTGIALYFFLPKLILLIP